METKLWLEDLLKYNTLNLNNHKKRTHSTRDVKFLKKLVPEL